YYTCSKKKRFRDCDKKNVRQEVIEAAVLNATIELLQDDELMEFLIENTWQYYQSQDESQEELNALQRQLEQVEFAIENLVKAIEAGIINDTTKRRMKELEAQQKELVTAIADREIARGFHITREYVDFFFRQFRDMDYTDRECQKQIIATFVNSIFLYDDGTGKINYNFSTDSRTITLSDVSSAEDGEVFVRCLQCSIYKKEAVAKWQVSRTGTRRAAKRVPLRVPFLLGLHLLYFLRDTFSRSDFIQQKGTHKQDVSHNRGAQKIFERLYGKSCDFTLKNGQSLITV
ncbi:MAG: zinc ribbon domain-containing protein, partial [Faecalimonas sp.]|nr:zinc ribbon domain-containing protein [Faecalimonas sp.]